MCNEGQVYLLISLDLKKKLKNIVLSEETRYFSTHTYEKVARIKLTTILSFSMMFFFFIIYV